MKVLLKRGLTEKYIKFINNKEDNINNEFEYIYVDHSCELDNILNIILPSKLYLYNENKLIYSLYGFLPYFIEKLNLIDEPYFELNFIEDEEYLKVNFNKLFEKKRTEKCFNIEYYLTINFKMTLTNFRINKEYLIPRIDINNLDGFKPNKIITIQKNTNDDYYVFSNIVIHELMKIINKNNILYK